MSFAEAGVVIDIHGEPLFWHCPNDRSAGALPDSRTLWDVLWDAEMVGTLAGFAHSHPGDGIPQPSHEDMTTFLAIENGLGRKLKWWITSASAIILVDTDINRRAPGDLRIPRDGDVHRQPMAFLLGGLDPVPSWADELRRRSRT